MRRLVVIGRTGQVAGELLAQAAARGVEVAALGRAEADLLEPDRAAAALARVVAGADAVINAAAWTAVDRAEAEEAAATAVNGASPAALARVAAAAGVPFLQISTDYVFDGGGTRPWRPEDPPAPLSAYGRSKLAGERGVRAAGGAHVILRTSWVFAGRGGNFVRTMLRLGAERPCLRVVADQWGGPTPAAAVAGALLTIADAFAAGRATTGTFHLSGAPDTTWAGFARAIFACAGMPVAVEEIATADHPAPARRPLNSRLDCTSLSAAYGIARPDWRAALPGAVAALRDT